MKVDSIHTHNNEVYRLQEIRRVDRRHLERLQDEVRIKHQHEIDEAKHGNEQAHESQWPERRSFGVTNNQGP